jgi:hypothetical protein
LLAATVEVLGTVGLEVKHCIVEPPAATTCPTSSNDTDVVLVMTVVRGHGCRRNGDVWPSVLDE